MPLTFWWVDGIQCWVAKLENDSVFQLLRRISSYGLKPCNCKMWGRRKGYVCHYTWEFCECCREPQYFCGAAFVLLSEERWSSDWRNLLSAAWRGLLVTWSSTWSIDLAPGELGFCLITDTLCWSNITSLGSCCKESPSCGKSSQWNRHIISQRGQEGLDVPTSRTVRSWPVLIHPHGSFYSNTHRDMHILSSPPHAPSHIYQCKYEF